MTLTAIRLNLDPVLDDELDPAPPVDEEAVRAVTEATLARLPKLTPPGPTSATPTDPACPGTRHGSYSAYKKSRCRCPEVRAYVNAQRDQQRVVRAALMAAGLIAKPAPPPPVDEGDVEAGLWAAKRYLPMPPGLRTAERVLIAHRLHRLPSMTWWGPMSAAEIAARIDRCERTVQRYLSTDPATAWTGQVTDVGDADRDDRDVAEA